MKKILLFVMVLSATISKTTVLASVTTKDATLIDQGKQNEASTMQWLMDATPNASLINMSLSSFNKEFKNALTEFNQKYKTFTVITTDVITDEIIPKLYTADLIEGKVYTLSYYDLATGKWGRWRRMAHKGETGLFFPDWDEPILSVWCWNFGYPSTTPPVVKRVEKPKPQDEYSYIPGKKVVIDYGPDTTIINRADVLIENNQILVRKNTRRYEEDITHNAVYMEEQEEEERVKPCKRKKRVVQDDCDCEDEHVCSKKKGTFLRDALLVTGGAVLGAVTYGVIKNNSGTKRRVVTQGPLITGGTTPRVITQGPLNTSL